MVAFCDRQVDVIDCVTFSVSMYVSCLWIRKDRGSLEPWLVVTHETSPMTHKSHCNQQVRRKW